MSRYLGKETGGTFALLILGGGVLPMLFWEALTPQVISVWELAILGTVVLLGSTYLLRSLTQSGRAMLAGLLKKKLIVVNSVLWLAGMACWILALTKIFGTP